METALKFRKFNRKKTVEELGYTISLWIAELEFTDVELQFIHQLIKSYPFTNNVPNLFERIQLFIKEISVLKKESSSLLNSIQNYTGKLQNIPINNKLDFDDPHVKEHENTASQVFDYMQKYQGFKRYIYEYISSITK